MERSEPEHDAGLAGIDEITQRVTVKGGVETPVNLHSRFVAQKTGGSLMKRVTILLLIALRAFRCIANNFRSVKRRLRRRPSSQTERNPAWQNREGAITGRVIGPDGRPMADARVVAFQMWGPDRRIRRRSSSITVSTTQSLWAYILLAYAPGYVSAETPSENAIHRIGENLTIRMIKGGVITGRVTDEAGEPVVGVGVKSPFVAGR